LKKLLQIDKLLGEIRASEEIILQEYGYFDEYIQKKLASYHELMNVPKKAKEELQIIEEKYKEYFFRSYLSIDSNEII